jgi:hypothetical protein
MCFVLLSLILLKSLQCGNLIYHSYKYLFHKILSGITHFHILPCPKQCIAYQYCSLIINNVIYPRTNESALLYLPQTPFEYYQTTIFALLSFPRKKHAKTYTTHSFQKVVRNICSFHLLDGREDDRPSLSPLSICIPRYLHS